MAGLLADPLHVPNLHRVFGLANLAHLGPEADEVAHLLLECGPNPVHPPYRLQHGGLLLESFFEMQMPMPER